MRPTPEWFESGLERIRSSPRDCGVVELIVRRPRPGEREILTAARLDVVEGLMGDYWISSAAAGQPSHADMQLSVMNSRVMALLAHERSLWGRSGDQLFVDLDLSGANLPPGTQLAVGDAVIVVSSQSHATCKAFASRFGALAAQFVHSRAGRSLRLRGINAGVVRSGT